MPILSLPREHEIIITYKCNWNCDYCAVETHKQRPLTEEEVLLKLDSIPNEVPVTLSGGEPALCENSLLLKALNTLESKGCSLYLNTNGLFLTKYRELCYKFTEIVYHCSQNLVLEKILKYDLPIDYMLIVNDNNFNKLLPFLEFNNHIKFSIVEATYPSIPLSYTLSKSNKNKLLTYYSKYMTPQSIQRLLKDKDFDSMVFI